MGSLGFNRCAELRATSSEYPPSWDIKVSAIALDVVALVLLALLLPRYAHVDHFTFTKVTCLPGIGLTEAMSQPSSCASSPSQSSNGIHEASRSILH